MDAKGTQGIRARLNSQQEVKDEHQIETDADVGRVYDKLLRGDWHLIRPEERVEPFLPYLVLLMLLRDEAHMDEEEEDASLAEQAAGLDALLVRHPQVNKVQEYLTFEARTAVRSILEGNTPSNVPLSASWHSAEVFPSLSAIEKLKNVTSEIQRLLQIISSQESEVPDLKQSLREVSLSPLLTTFIFEELQILLPAIYFAKGEPSFLRHLVQLCFIMDDSNRLLVSLLLNCPQERAEVVEKVLEEVKHCQRLSGYHFLGSRGTEFFFTVAKISPNSASFLRAMLVRTKQLPDLIVKITVEVLGDEVSFLEEVLADVQTKGDSNNKVAAHWLLSRLASKTKEEKGDVDLSKKLLSSLSAAETTSGNLGDIVRRLRFLAILYGLLGKTCTEAEAKSICQIVGQLCKLKGNATSSSSFSSPTTALFQTAFALVIISTACRLQSNNAPDMTYYSIVDATLRALFNTGSIRGCMLVVALYFHYGQLLLVFNLLGTAVQARLEHLSPDALQRVGDVLYKPLFTEGVIVREAASLPGVAGSSRLGEHELDGEDEILEAEATVTVVYLLLKEKIFVKNKIDCSGYILRQLQASSPPSHPLVPELLLLYADACGVEASARAKAKPAEPVMNAIPEGSVKTIVSSLSSLLIMMEDEENESFRTSYCADAQERSKRRRKELYQGSLVVLFVLKYCQAAGLIGVLKLPPQTGSKGIVAYDLFSLPVNLLLRRLRSPLLEKNRFSCLEEHIFKLAAETCPSLFQDFESIISCGVTPATTSSKRIAAGTLLEVIVQSNSNSDWKEKVTRVFSLTTTSVSSRDRTARILVLKEAVNAPLLRANQVLEIALEFLSDALEVDREEELCGLAEAIQMLWKRVIPLHPSPSVLRLRLASALCQLPFEKDKTFREVVMDPSQLLSCSHVVLRNPRLLELLLSVLHFFIFEARHWHQGLARALESSTDKAAEGGQGNNADPAEASPASSLPLLQESLIIHGLIELCEGPRRTETDPTEELQKGEELLSEELRLEAIRDVVCRFLGRLFVENPTVMKLVHFQGYDRSLLPVLLRGIPTLQRLGPLLSDFLLGPSELEEEQLLFQLTFIAEFVTRYPEATFKKHAKAVIRILRTYCTEVLSGDCRSTSRPRYFLLQSLPSLPPICHAYPDLSTITVELLLEFKPGGMFEALVPASEEDSLQRKVLETFKALVQGQFML